MTQNFDLMKLTSTSCVRAVASAQHFHPSGEDTVCGGDRKSWPSHCLQRANTDAQFDYVAPAGSLMFPRLGIQPATVTNTGTEEDQHTPRAEALPAAPPCTNIVKMQID